MTFKEHIENYKYELDILNLSLYNLDLTDIYGIEKYTKLEKLNLSYNKIIDLSPLRDLNNITNLNISHNNIKDLSPLKNLRKISNLDFGNNEISDIEPLKELNQLKILYFFDNKISDLSPLKNMNLVILSFPRNLVNDITIIYNMKNLMKLGSHDNPIDNHCEISRKSKKINGNWIIDDNLKKLQLLLKRKYLISLIN